MRYTRVDTCFTQAGEQALSMRRTSWVLLIDQVVGVGVGAVSVGVCQVPVELCKMRARSP